MKGKYSIGYKDDHNDFRKVWDEKGGTRKWVKIEDCREYIENCTYKTVYKIMQGWTVIEIVDKT